jgi:hypothetical protein
MVVITKQRVMIVFGFLLACIALPFLFGGTPKKSPNTVGMAVRNDTQALQVDAFDVTADGHLRLVLKNVSSKDVNGYVISFGDRYQVTNDLSSGDRVIAPGATDKLDFPTKDGLAGITITAAMFADGTVEGEPGIVQHLTLWRAELKSQLTRGLLLLNDAVDSPDTQSSQVLDRIESAFSTLPSDTPGIRSRGGLHYAQDSLMDELRDIRSRRARNPNLDQRRNLLELRERIKRRIASN